MITALLNASLQVVGTGLIVFGADVIYRGDQLANGIVLIAAGLIAYLVYEFTPSK